MSKSYRKHPFSPITTAVSEKQDKRLANRKLRRIARECLKQGKEPPHHIRAVSNVYDFAKDGHFRFFVFPLPVIRIFYANRKQGNRPVFRFVFQHHCSNNRQTALFKCRLKPHPPSARMLNQPLFLAFPIRLFHTLTFVVLFLTFCQTDFHLDFSA